MEEKILVGPSAFRATVFSTCVFRNLVQNVFCDSPIATSWSVVLRAGDSSQPDRKGHRVQERLWNTASRSCCRSRSILFTLETLHDDLSLHAFHAACPYRTGPWDETRSKQQLWDVARWSWWRGKRLLLSLTMVISSPWFSKVTEMRLSVAGCKSTSHSGISREGCALPCCMSFAGEKQVQQPPGMVWIWNTCCVWCLRCDMAWCEESPRRRELTCQRTLITRQCHPKSGGSEVTQKKTSFLIRILRSEVDQWRRLKGDQSECGGDAHWSEELLLHPEFLWWAARPFLGLVHGMSSSEEGVVEETAKGSCVYTDLKRMELVSSSSSWGRPSRCPQGVCSWRTPTPPRLGLIVTGRERNTEQNNSTSPRSQGKAIPRLQRWLRSPNDQKASTVYLTTSQIRGSLNFIFDS